MIIWRAYDALIDFSIVLYFNKMKRLIILFFMMFFSCMTTKSVLAACNDASMLTYTTCNSLADCDLDVEAFPISGSDVDDYKTHCESTYNGSACTEILNLPGVGYTVMCYMKINQPTPTTPHPTSCGLLGGICCKDGEDKWFCREDQGGPAPDGTSCYCRATAPTVEPTFPVASPTPDPYVDGDGISLTFTSDKEIFCGAGDKPSETPLDPENPYIYTAFGCMPVKSNAFIKWLLPFLFGIAGGIAFLLMISGFFMILTSRGDPKVVQAGREKVTAAITGLLVILFSVFLLRLILVGILKIPGVF
jgi:hypothetical protein